MTSKIHADYHTVTLLQLLAHQAGLPDDRTPDRVIWPQVRALSGPLPAQRRRLIELVLSRAPAAPPGTRFQYSNYGYTIAGALVEQVMGQPWEELMAQYLFRPLGMGSAGFGPPGTRGTTDQPWGHRGDSCEPLPPGPNADNPAVIGPAGSAHASIGDWARYASVHLRGARGEGGLPLKPETFRVLHRPSLGDYALGWGVRQQDLAGGTALAHAGSNTLWFAGIWIAPAKNVALLVATNCGGTSAPRASGQVLEAMQRKYLA